MNIENPHGQPDNKTEEINEIRRLLSMYRSDLANAAEGTQVLSPEDEQRAMDEITRLKNRLAELEQGT